MTAMIQNYCRATYFRYSKNHQWRMRIRLNTAVCIVNVDIGVAKLRGGACQLARPVWKLDLNDLTFCVGYSFAVQDRTSGRRFVHDEAHKDRFLRRNRLKSHDVHLAVSERPADFSK